MKIPSLACGGGLGWGCPTNMGGGLCFFAVQIHAPSEGANCIFHRSDSGAIRGRDLHFSTVQIHAPSGGAICTFPPFRFRRPQGARSALFHRSDSGALRGRDLHFSTVQIQAPSGGAICTFPPFRFRRPQGARSALWPLASILSPLCWQASSARATKASVTASGLRKVSGSSPG